jgi:hypothetical protein
MWAQLIKFRVKPGAEDQLRSIEKEFEARGRDGSTGWVRTFALHDQNDPQVYYNLVYFESEEKARENERRSQQSDLIGRMQALMDGSPEFVDLLPVFEASRGG